MNARETTALAVGAIVVLALGRGASRGKITLLMPNDGPDEGLISRANQRRASYWAGEFTTFAGVSQEFARALGRWAGIESGGDPLALSPIGERGLLQSTRTTALKEGAFSPSEWVELQNRSTVAARHADLAVKFSRWIWARAKRHIRTVPTDDASVAWYSKLYHTRPVDLRDAKATGNAIEDARRLERAWANDPKALHRLRAANVVAWGVLRP